MNNFNSVIEKLNETFDVDGPIDISPFFHKDGKKWLYDLLKNKHRETFESNYRMVMYFNDDEYFYSNYPGTLIDTLQKYVSEIDISHNFIVVISSDDKVKTDLETVRKMYSTDELPITHIKCYDIDAEYSPHGNESVDTFCIKPWIHLYVGTDGNVFPCCQSENTPVANINDGTIDEIKNSSKFKLIRTQMLSNEKPIDCSVCYEMERSNCSSLRNRTNKRYEHLIASAIENTLDDGGIVTPILTADIRLSNVCNFKCRMCTGYASSSIHKEEEKIYGASRYNVLTVVERNEALGNILPNIHTIEDFYFAGGEPFLIKEYYMILDKLIELKKFDVSLSYSSNLSTLIYKNKSITEYWKKFSNVTLKVSVDDSGDGATYSRHGTIWNNVMNNLSVVRAECPHVDIEISSTYNIYNAFNLITFQKELILQEVVSPKYISFNVLHVPEYTAIQILPNHFKITISELISQHMNFLNDYNVPHLIKSWEDAMAYLNAVDNSFMLSKFFKYNDTLDKYRKENFTDVYPEYKQLRTYIS